MKKVFFLISLLAALNSSAQENGKIILTKGQKITVITSSSTDADMSMGMQMKNATNATNTLYVLGDDPKNFTISNTLTKLNISMDFMGQQTAYDSEKPEDKESETGKVASKTLNVADTLVIDKITGDVIDSKKNSSPEKPDESNPLAGMMQAFGNSGGDVVVGGAFFIIPAGKKTGETWTDSTSEKNIKTTKTYTLKTIDKNVATILLNGNAAGTTETEMQGSTVTVSMNTQTTGEINVNVKTSLVNKINTIAEITGNIEVMGQSMPVTSKTQTSVVFQY